MANEYALMEVLHAARSDVAGDGAKVGQMLVNAVKIKLSHPGTGHTYLSRMKAGDSSDPYHQGHVYVPGSAGHLHQASAPGEPPAVDTGIYRASWSYEVADVPNMVVIHVGTPQKIGPWLEYGTSKMQSRPHIRPVVAENALAISGLVADGIVRREKDKARELGGRG